MQAVYRLSVLRPIGALLALLTLPPLLTLTLSHLSHRLLSPSLPVSLPAPAPISVILDPGHGGIDGGAVGESGTLEKDLNLAVAKRLSEILTDCGVNVLLTREEDTLPDSGGEGSRKMRDLQARLAVMQEHPDALFVSIHMNRFPSSAVRGTQIWYAEGEGSAALAEAILRAVKERLQPDNRRPCKQADSGIFLLHRAVGQAVLVECGFLSCPEEEALLLREDYQTELCLALASAILSHLAAEGG